MDEAQHTYEVFIELPRRTHLCPHCQQATDKVKDYRLQAVQDTKVASFKTTLFLRKRRYVCPHCGKCFAEDNPLVAKYQRITSRLNAG